MEDSEVGKELEKKRKRVSPLAVNIKNYCRTIQIAINNTLNNGIQLSIAVEDAADTKGNPTGLVSIAMDVTNDKGWGRGNEVMLNGFVGTQGSQGNPEKEAEVNGVQVGSWEGGANAIRLGGCGIGEFLVHIFSLLAIKANNTSIVLDNAGGPRAERVYRKIGFRPFKNDMYNMVLYLTGKTRNISAAQIWKTRYNKYRKKLIGNLANKKCSPFWRTIPPAFGIPGAATAKGIIKPRTRRTRKKKIFSKTYFDKKKKTKKKKKKKKKAWKGGRRRKKTRKKRKRSKRRKSRKKRGKGPVFDLISRENREEDENLKKLLRSLRPSPVVVHDDYETDYSSSDESNDSSSEPLFTDDEDSSGYSSGYSSSGSDSSGPHPTQGREEYERRLLKRLRGVP